MGHIRLGVLPKSQKWQQVIEELRLGSEVNTVAAAAADAAEARFQRASNDPAFLHAFWLLTQIPLAARGPAFAASGLRSQINPALWRCSGPSQVQLTATLRSTAVGPISAKWPRWLQSRACRLLSGQPCHPCSVLDRRTSSDRSDGSQAESVSANWHESSSPA